MAEVLVGLVRRSTDSILSVPGWKPSLPSAKPGTFNLTDLLRFAGVLAQTTPRTYTVKSGRLAELDCQEAAGRRHRWREIFLLNRASSAPRSDLPRPGARLAGRTPTRKRPRVLPGVYLVKKGDTLSGIAAAELGDAARWPDIFTLNRAVLTNPT